jgi:hypothetical protein
LIQVCLIFFFSKWDLRMRFFHLQNHRLFLCFVYTRYNLRRQCILSCQSTQWQLTSCMIRVLTWIYSGCPPRLIARVYVLRFHVPYSINKHTSNYYIYALR